MLAKTLPSALVALKRNPRPAFGSIRLREEKGYSKPFLAGLQPIAMSEYLHCPECAHCAAMTNSQHHPAARVCLLAWDLGDTTRGPT